MDMFFVPVFGSGSVPHGTVPSVPSLGTADTGVELMGDWLQHNDTSAMVMDADE